MKCHSPCLVQVLPVLSMQCLSETSSSRAPCGLQREPTPNHLGQLVFPEILILVAVRLRQGSVMNVLLTFANHL